ncbi:histidinol-phosphate transaminase [Oceanobacillus massiliensis]|uniref:histidinol-phosphate transaminase n=1 Tax=Oceanobacillus massiliensis TaxID=1465765 RepID=UPI000287F077|nr:histidinol-phosphate transaminase [Oceanobacillus massiliensis]
MSKFWSEAARRCKPYVPGEQINRTDIIKLNTNENPYPPSPKVIQEIQRETDRKLNLYPSPTADKLREDIASFYQLSKENIFVGNGSDEILAFSFVAFFDTDKKIRYPAISYSFYPVYADLFGIPAEEVPLHEDFTLPVKDFFQAEGGVIFPNPNAPTSVYLGLDSVKEILESNPDQIVIVDEAYIDFAEASATSLINTYENLLVIQTMSKSRSLAGLRVGFAMGQPELIEGLVRIKDSFNSYTLDRLAIAGAEAAIRDVDYFKDTTNKIIMTREWTVSEMKKRGYSVLPSQTNFIFATHPDQRADRLYANLKENGILVRHFKSKPIENYIRITIGTDEQMQKLLRTLDSLTASS